MKLSTAYILAATIVEQLVPYCERVEIAGSIRRAKPEPGDIEIVCRPRMEMVQNLFNQTTAITYPLYEYLNLAFSRTNHLIKGGLKYRQYKLEEGINLDLFIVTPPAEWGVQFLIRTGPADFSKWMVTQRKHGGALPSNLRCMDGAIWRGITKMRTPEERDVFELCGLKWVDPRERIALWPEAKKQVLQPA